MTYIDGFVAAVPTANREKFKKHADEAAAIFKEYGALSVVECWGDDVPDGKITSFPMAVQRKDDDRGVLVDRLAIKGGAQGGLGQGDGRSPHEARGEPHAI